MDRIKIFIFSSIFFLLMLLSLGWWLWLAEISECRIYTDDFVIYSFYEKKLLWDAYMLTQVDVPSNKCYFICDYTDRLKGTYLAREIIEWDVSFIPNSYYYTLKENPFIIPSNSVKTIIFIEGDSYYSITTKGGYKIYAAGMFDQSTMRCVGSVLEFSYDPKVKDAIYVFKNERNYSVETLSRFKSFADNSLYNFEIATASTFYFTLLTQPY